MGDREQLQRQAQDLGGWVRAHGADFAPMRVRDVRADVARAPEGQPVVQLTVVLDDPADRRSGWPAEPLFGLIDAVNRESRHTAGMFVQVFPQAVSDGVR
jgi:hypothetical protein